MGARFQKKIEARDSEVCGPLYTPSGVGHRPGSEPKRNACAVVPERHLIRGRGDFEVQYPSDVQRVQALCRRAAIRR